MIRKIFLFSIVFSIYTFAQTETEQQNPNIELPDFVITGQDILSIEKAKKMDPEFISTISEQALKPVFSAEQLEVKDITNPVKDDIALFDSLNNYPGRIKAGAGFYTLPLAEIRYAVPFSSGIVEGYAGGKNIRSYVVNSSRYDATAGLNLNLFTSSNASFLPGSKFRLHGDYGASAFKFFGGPQPNLKRELRKGNFEFLFNHLSGYRATAGIRIGDDYNQLNKEDFSEHYFYSDGFVKVNFSSFNISVSGAYNRQMLSLDAADMTRSIGSVRPAIGLNISRTFKTSLGITYAKSGDESLLAPYGSMSIKFNKSLSAFAEYSPTAKIYSAGHFLTLNRYFNVQNFRNVYSEEVNMSGSLKYEYDKYFQIDAGVKFKSSDRLPYFTAGDEGKFNINVTDGKVITAFTNLLFHRGPYGNFYGTVELISAKDTGDYAIPYYPELNAELSYGFNVGVLGLHSTLYYFSGAFTVIPNTNELNSHINLGAGADLKLNESFSLFFEVNNILNRANYFWSAYKEPPLDLLGGFIYRW